MTPEIRNGNHKLGIGKGVWTFDLPVGATCPGRSAVCRKLCYASYGMSVSDDALALRKRNYEATQQADFVSRMVDEVYRHRRACKVLRWHSSGDFFSLKYIRAVRLVVGILSQMPGAEHIVHYCHSRSWAVPSLLPELLLLGSMPTFHLWFSWDSAMQETAEKIRSKVGGRWCYLSQDDNDLPPWPCELVFRHPRYQRYGARSWTEIENGEMGGSPVCPHEDGVHHSQCFNCRRKCWTKEKAIG